MTNNAPQSENLKHALCYIPVVAFVLFFTEDNKSTNLMKHIKYGGALFVFYFVLSFILPWPLASLLSLVYIGIAGVFGYKAYNGENVDIELIDDLEGKIKDSMNDVEKK